MPTYIMPSFLQTLSRFIPHAWAVQGFQDVLVRGYGLWYTSEVGRQVLREKLKWPRHC